MWSISWNFEHYYKHNYDLFIDQFVIINLNIKEIVYKQKKKFFKQNNFFSFDFFNKKSIISFYNEINIKNKILQIK